MTAPAVASAAWSDEYETQLRRFGPRLAELRRQRGLSQEAMASRAGLHRNQISNLERGTGLRPRVAESRLSTLCRIAVALDLAPIDLLPILGAVPSGEGTGHSAATTDSPTDNGPAARTHS